VDPLIYGVPIKAAEVPTHQRLLKRRCEAARASLGSIVADRFLWTSILATANCLLGTNFRSVKGSGPGRLGPKEWDRVMPRSLMDGLRQFFGQQSSRADAARQPKPSSPSPRRYMTRIGVVLAIEAPHPGPHGATVFVQRLGSPVTAFDYQMQFPTEGPGTFRFLAPPSPLARKMMRSMDFQPEDGRNQVWVRKSSWDWSAKELVDAINLLHLIKHHGHVFPDQRYSDDG
jgi:hypothetical protein